MSTLSAVDYHSVPDDEQDTYLDFKKNPGIEQNLQTMPSGKTAALIILATIAVFVTVLGAVGAALARESVHNCAVDCKAHLAASAEPFSPAANGTTPAFTSCGHSPSEARARGCSFDITSFAWLTPECYDHTSMEEFLSWSDWSWYASEEPRNLTTLPFETAVRGEYNMFVDWNYHLVHCTFMWRQQHRAMEQGYIGRHLVHYEHTLHCQHTLLQDAQKNRDIRTPARVVYPPCLKIGTEEGMYPGPLGGLGSGW